MHSDPDVEAILYWTGGLAAPRSLGWDCTLGDWTCEGGTTIGIDRYATAMDLDVTPSPFSDRQWYWDAPEVAQW